MADNVDRINVIWNGYKELMGSVYASHL